VFIVFSGLTAYLTYQENKILGAPSNYNELSTIAAMLPTLLAAVISFTVAAFTMRAKKSEAEKETEPQTKPETDVKETLT
jgi:hypothetical protein